MGKKYKINSALWVLVLGPVVILTVSLLSDVIMRFCVDRLVDKIYYCERLEGQVMTGSNSIAEIDTVSVQRDGIYAEYPRIVSGAAREDIDQWNMIIKQDFDKLMQIYSFQPFPGPTPSSTDVVPTMLQVLYDVKGNTGEWFSIFYQADYNSIYSAHPSNLVYTTNINKRENKRIHLADIVKLNDAFVKDFRSWTLIAPAEVPQEVREAIDDYIGHITEEELLLGFQAADHIGSDNPWGIYSYLTEDKLGISLEVPHYAGDHVEFEQPLARLGMFLKPEFEVETIK
ncbi:MAG: hypothetical protein K0R46_3324 [Herbinix sp.]|nr:hypothetical protein [Herbinix sp.]